MKLSEFVQVLEDDAKAVWNELKKEAVVVEQAVENEVSEVMHKIIPLAEHELVDLMSQLKASAFQKVHDLAKEEFQALSGQEKQSLVVTHLIQAAEALGVELSSLLWTAVRTLAQAAFNALAITAPASPTEAA